MSDQDDSCTESSEEEAEELPSPRSHDGQQQQRHGRPASQLPEPGPYATANLHLVHRVPTRLQLFIAPTHAGDVGGGVRRVLNEQLLRYHEELGGVLLAYSGLTITSGAAAPIGPWHPYLAIEASADMLVFTPRAADILCGRVAKLSAGLLVLRVLGGISVVISSTRLPPGLEYDEENRCWVPDGDYTAAIFVGDLVQCAVVGSPMQDLGGEDDCLFNLEGSLIGHDTGLCSWQLPQQQRRRERIAAILGEDDELQGGGDAEQQRQQQQKQKKQGKKDKHKAKAAPTEQQQPSQSKEERRAAKQQRKAAKAAAKAAAAAAAGTGKRRKREAGGGDAAPGEPHAPPAKKQKRSKHDAAAQLQSQANGVPATQHKQDKAHKKKKEKHRAQQ